MSFALHWPKTSASFGQNWSNSSTMKIEKYLINQPVIFMEKHATRRFVISINWIYIECSICSLQHSAPANLHNPLLSSFSDHSFFGWFRIIVYSIKTHSTFLTPLSLQMGDSRCVEFWSNCPLCFPPVESKFTTHQYSITSDEKMVEFLRQPIFRLKNRSECKSSLHFPYISFSVSTEVIFC